MSHSNRIFTISTRTLWMYCHYMHSSQRFEILSPNTQMNSLNLDAEPCAHWSFEKVESNDTNFFNIINQIIKFALVSYIVKFPGRLLPRIWNQSHCQYGIKIYLMARKRYLIDGIGVASWLFGKFFHVRWKILFSHAGEHARWMQGENAN